MVMNVYRSSNFLLNIFHEPLTKKGGSKVCVEVKNKHSNTSD